MSANADNIGLDKPSSVNAITVIPYCYFHGWPTRPNHLSGGLPRRISLIRSTLSLYLFPEFVRKSLVIMNLRSKVPATLRKRPKYRICNRGCQRIASMNTLKMLVITASTGILSIRIFPANYPKHATLANLYTFTIGETFNVPGTTQMKENNQFHHVTPE